MRRRENKMGFRDILRRRGISKSNVLSTLMKREQSFRPLRYATTNEDTGRRKRRLGTERKNKKKKKLVEIIIVK